MINFSFSFDKIFRILIFLIPLMPFGVGIPLGPLQSLDLPKILTGITILFMSFVIFHKGSIKMFNNDIGVFAFYSFIVVALGSIILSPVKGTSLKFFLGFILMHYSGFFLATQALRNWNNLYSTIKIIKLAFIVLIVLSITEYISGTNIFDPYRTAYLNNDSSRFFGDIGRLFRSSKGPFASNLPYAYLLTSLFFINLIRTGNSFLDTKFYIVTSSLLSIVGIFFAQSRASYVVITLTIIMYVTIKLRKHIIKLLFAYIFLIVISIAGFNYIQNIPVIGTFFTEYVINVAKGEKVAKNTNTASDRVDANAKELLNLAPSPILGRGFFFLTFLKSGKINTSKGEISDTDTSMYLALLVDTGILGFTLFLTFIGISFLKLFNILTNRKYLHNEKGIALGLGCAVFSYFILLLFSYRIEGGFLPFFFIGMVTVLYQLASKRIACEKSPVNNNYQNIQ